MNKEPTPSADPKPVVLKYEIADHDTGFVRVGYGEKEYPKPVSKWKQTGTCKCGHPIMEKKCADGEALETRTHHVCPLTGEEEMEKFMPNTRSSSKKKKPYIYDGAYRIPLTKGEEALIDIDDFGLVSGKSWQCLNYKYAVGTTDKTSGRKTVLIHRVIAKAGKEYEVDHVNGNGLDNRKCNLRICTRAENVRNLKVQNRNKSSQYKGVSFYKGRWQSKIQHNKRCIWLGYFASENEAAKAYNNAASKYFKEFAKLNVIRSSPSES